MSSITIMTVLEDEHTGASAAGSVNGIKNSPGSHQITRYQDNIISAVDGQLICILHRANGVFDMTLVYTLL